MTEFTAEQLEHYRRYEEVRASGRFNMMHPVAAQAANLTRDELFFVIKNFAALDQAYNRKQNENQA